MLLFIETLQGVEEHETQRVLITSEAWGSYVKMNSMCQPASACSGPSKLKIVLDEAPPSPKETHTKGMTGCPETETSNGALYDTQFRHSPPDSQPS